MFGKKKHTSSLPDAHYESLDEKVKAYKKIFDEKGFTETECPKTRYYLNQLMLCSVRGALPDDMKPYFIGLQESSLEEFMVEDSCVMDPRKIKDAKYDESVLLQFKDMILDINADVLKQKSHEMMKFWLKVSERRAEKGHRWIDLNYSISRAESYAEYCGQSISDKIKEHFLSLQTQGIKDMGRRNAEMFRHYVVRQFSYGISKKRFKHLLKTGEDLATEMKTSLWKDEMWSSTTELLLHEDKVLINFLNGEREKKDDETK